MIPPNLIIVRTSLLIICDAILRLVIGSRQSAVVSFDGKRRYADVESARELLEILVSNGRGKENSWPLWLRKTNW